MEESPVVAAAAVDASGTWKNQALLALLAAVGTWRGGGVGTGREERYQSKPHGHQGGLDSALECHNTHPGMRTVTTWAWVWKRLHDTCTCAIPHTNTLPPEP